MSKNIIIDGVEGVWTEKPAPPSELPDGYLSPHFRRSEFTCNHCGTLPHDPPGELLEILEDVRQEFDAPVTVTSGYRCSVHNANVGGARHSQHRYVTAADIQVRGVDAVTVHGYCAERMKGMGGLGKYATFTHVDVRGNGPARW
jgi:uncharacterized protein YcbK (DUF882 family)